MPPTSQIPLRAAIYARYSSENQSENSIDDQVRICRVRAEREGWQVVDVYADYALSGASGQRPRFLTLLEAARSGKYDVVLAEALDRISRDQEHIAGFYKHLRFADVRMITIAEGDICELHIGLKGTMSALFLKDLALRTHRGLEGRVRAGSSGGGLSFGYRVVHRTRPDGLPTAGGLEIVPDQAVLVRQIFTDYVGDQSPRAIAVRFNAEGVPGPRGGRWTASLILGNAAREIGILRNRLYAGERVWNRQHFLKDPMTGKRIARPNPPETWIISAVPELRIVDEALWQAAQVRLAAARRAVKDRRSWMDVGGPMFPGPETVGGRLAAVRRPRWLLSGLVRCGLCDGPMGVVSNGGRLGCANHRERGTCGNRRTVLRGRLLDRVLDGLKHRLLAPELVETFVREFVAEVNAANRESGRQKAQLRQEQAKIGRQIRNLLELIKDGHGSAAMVQELREMERRKSDVDAAMVSAGTPEQVPVLHSNLPELYRRKVEALEAALQDTATASSATEVLRTLVDAIMVFPGDRRGEVTIELRGDLAAFMHVGDDGSPARTAVLRVGNSRSVEVMGSLVAGARNHLDLMLTG